MDFTIPEELAALRKSFATFLDREVRPVEESLREEFAALEPDHPRLRAAGLAVRKRSADEGFYACYLPEDAAAGASRRSAPACWSRMLRAADSGSPR